MQEIWKDINVDNRYQISTAGRVYSTITNKILKPIYINSSGNYIQTVVSLGGKRYSVSRLVAEAFIPNPENKPEVDHINTDTTDNRVENLRWVTSKENHNNPLTRKHYSESKIGTIPWDYGKTFTDEHKQNISNSLKGKYIGNKNPNSKVIIQLSKDGEFIKEWECLKYICEELHIKQPNISNALRRKGTAGGYRWAYKT